MIRGVVNRMLDRPDDPAVFLVYIGWACSLHPSLFEHRNVHVLASTFCCCIRGLWTQREHKLMAQTVTIIRNVMTNEGGTNIWNHVEMNIKGQLEHSMENITVQYMQHYESATTTIPQLQQPLIRAKYKDNETDAFNNIHSYTST